MSELPDEVWEYLAADFYSLPNGRELLVVQDRKSRFPVVCEVPTTASEYVNPKLDELFSFIGIPKELMTDNDGHSHRLYAHSHRLYARSSRD
jgi:hypothetical protein